MSVNCKGMWAGNGLETASLVALRYAILGAGSKVQMRGGWILLC